MALQFEWTARENEIHAPAAFFDCDAPAPIQLPTRGFVIGATLLNGLDRVGYGGLVLDQDAETSSASTPTAGGCWSRNWAGAQRWKRPGDWLRRAARRLQDSITPWFPPEQGDLGDYSLHGRPAAGPASHPAQPGPTAAGAHVVMILADFGAVPQPNPATLRRIFGLTGAEAKLAVQIGRGDTLASIARENNVRVATVRSQLAAVFGKTQTRRQTELAMLLARMAILP